jgi:hypothetical protein
VTGFIKKLFRAKPKDAEAASEVAKPEVIKPKTIKPNRVERGNAYYLSADDAQTFGNLEYMRSAKTVRHTFPKGKVGKDNARIRAISYAESINSDGSPPAPLMPNSQSASQAAQGSGSVSSDASRRRPDSSMDAFRNMAREIKKG